MTMTPVTLFDVFVNRMSLTLGTGQPHNDFCLLLCVCVYVFWEGGGRSVSVGGELRVEVDKISNKTLHILPLINQHPHSFLRTALVLFCPDNIQVNFCHIR